MGEHRGPLRREQGEALLESIHRVYAIHRWTEAILIGEIDPQTAEYVQAVRILDAALRWHERAEAA